MNDTALHLSLVSHTNVGKTTLARTLLQRDVGEVRDAAHVTDFADGFTLLRTAQGETLQLWDTPGFGDSARLLRRLQQARNPLGWLAAQVWDRWRDRPFWASQQALRHVAERADVLLYLVSAAEDPAGAAYVDDELALLAWVDKPVIVLLNQLGPPREAAIEAAELQRWRERLRRWPRVTEVLPLDAFARCWVQEAVLWRAVEACLAGDAQLRMQRLADAWRRQQLRTYGAALSSLANSLARVAAAREMLSDAASLRARLRSLGSALGLAAKEPEPIALAQAALAARLDAEVRDSTGELLALHGLAGSAQGEILKQLASHFEARLRLDEGRSALWGGMLSGALLGLKADLATGGLTLGGGLIAGGLLGALGGAGLARAVNRVRGTDSSWLAWRAEALDAITEAALLRYLAVAHFGRGRGEWVASETPAHWHAALAAALQPRAAALGALWSRRGSRPLDASDTRSLAAALEPLLDATLRDTLARLYPASPVPGATPLDEPSGLGLRSAS